MIQSCRQGIHALRPIPSRHLWSPGKPWRLGTGGSPRRYNRRQQQRFWLPGASAFWDAGLHPASQRRTSSVVARWKWEYLRPRCSCAGGLLPSRDSRTGTLYREGCPAAPLCGSSRAAGTTSPSTIACPARPGERCFPRARMRPRPRPRPRPRARARALSRARARVRNSKNLNLGRQSFRTSQ